MPATKTQLTIEHSTPCPGMTTLVHITDGKGRSDYWFDVIPSDFGVAFRARKIWQANDFAEGAYDVLVDGEQSSCECMGHLRHGHCRHVDAARKLIEAGITRKQPTPEQAVEHPGKQYLDEDYSDCI